MESVVIDRDTRVNGLSIHYVAWGIEGNPAVILLHGLRAYGRWFEPLGELLANDYRVIAPDLRGRNRSDWSPAGDYSTDVYVSDVAALADDLGLPRFVLGGHSLGGTIAANFVAKYPERVQSLILFDASPEPDAAGVNRIKGEVAQTPAGFASWDAASEFLRRLHPVASKAYFATRLQCMLKQVGDGSVTWRIDPVCTKRIPDPAERTWNALRAIRCPTLIIRGAQSDILRADTCGKMLATIPGSECVVIEKAGHMVLEDNPMATAKAVAAFLAQRPAASDKDRRHG